MAVNTTTTKGDQITGAAGAVPPAHAPREVVVGLGDAPTAVPAHARGNEQELKPLPAFDKAPLAGAELIAAVGPKRAAEIEASRAAAAIAAQPATPSIKGATVSTPAPRQMKGRRPAVTTAVVDAVAAGAAAVVDAVETAAAGAATAGAAPGTAAAIVRGMDRPLAAEDLEKTGGAPDYTSAVDFVSAASAALTPNQRDGVISLSAPLPHQKAASDTDSPSRGIPRLVTDPGKKITGGFGSAMEAQYYPLDGRELRTLVEGLLSEVHVRIQDDLRFGIAVTYPRVRARVQVIIEGVGNDQDFIIPRVAVPPAAGAPGSTPHEIALQFGEEIVFVVEAKREEFDADGNSVTPPDAMRQQLGVTGPRKQAIKTAIGHSIVDVVTSPGR